MRVSFIGGGNMAQAIMGGLIHQGASVSDLLAVEPDTATQAKLSALHIPVTPQINEATLRADLIVLAVKPQVLQEAITPLVGGLNGQVIVSIAAGARIATLASWLGGYRCIVRAMPNTPALIQRGITGLYATADVDAAQRAAAEAILGAVGKTHWVDQEALLDVVTAISGSGPAYVFYFIEALEQAAIDLGLAPDIAHLFATETFVGGALLAAESSFSPAQLRANVTSKRGTTERAIETFDKAELQARFIEGVKAACIRSRELGNS
ncbi:MAG: pyrroline-5-carboxylate reductase [Betaproteobacteria bacterium]|nr:pyrroline-5-carboxylate reductase [Betaproteobacteria bacterium]